jgi:hypothetical protein
MKKSIALVAVFLAVFAVNANAGQLTVANTDITLAGGISASYNYVSDGKVNTAAPTETHVDDSDNFDVDNAIVHLFKNPTADSPVGGHLAFGTFHVKTPTGQHVIPDIGYGEFSPWLAYFSWMPGEMVTIDAGLLWHKFGEPPITILNPNITRPVAFLAQPVCFGGARVSVDAGPAKLYAGMNNGSALGTGHGAKAGNERAFEVGASANVAETLNVAVNYFDHDEGYNTINMSVGTEAGICSAKLEANYVTADTENLGATEDSATTYALYASFKFSDNFKLPVRIELVDDNDSLIYWGTVSYDGWNIAITPTYNPTKNSFIRAEIVYALDDNKVFADDDGVENQEDNRTSVIAEFGFLF